MLNKQEILHRIVDHRTPHFNPDFPLILFWSPKSGCTTFAKWFYFQIGLLDTALKYNSWIHLYGDQVYKTQLNYKKMLAENLLASNKDTIKLVRDPYKRAVSQFLILATTKGLLDWEKEWEKIREYFYKDKKSKYGISFKQFLHYINDTEAYDDHFSSQYFEGEEAFVKDYIHLESFGNQIAEIEKKYGLKKSNILTITNSTHHLSSSMVLSGNNSEMKFTTGEFTPGRKFPTYESFYDKETTDLVNHIFIKDFEIYGYKQKK